MIDINIGQFFVSEQIQLRCLQHQVCPSLNPIFQMYIDSETRPFKTPPMLASDFSSCIFTKLTKFDSVIFVFTFIAYLEISKRWLFCSQNVNKREGWLQARAHAADRGRWHNNHTENNVTGNNYTGRFFLLFLAIFSTKMKEKKLAKPTRSFFTLKISWKIVLVGCDLFFILVLKIGRNG